MSASQPKDVPIGELAARPRYAPPMRACGILLVGTSVIACGGTSRAPETATPSAVATIAPANAADAGAPSFAVSESGELAMPVPITFAVRPLAGPGSMGPPEVAPSSVPALDHIAAYARHDPTARIRVECAVNAMKMSSGPNVARGVHLAKLVTRAVAARDIACERLDALGVLVERDPNAPAEAVRVFVRASADESRGARAPNPCAD